MKNPNDPRHAARMIAVQQLFIKQFEETEKKKTEEFAIEDFIEINQLKDYSEELRDKLVIGVRKSREEIDEVITEYAPQWPIDQIKKVDLQILRIAIFEGFIEKITPPKVAIDEAIELAKEFGGNASDKFVNGVLGAIYEKKPKKKK
jgi:N utilization substance protein B